MIQDLGNSIFDNSYHNYNLSEKDSIIVCKDNKVLVNVANGIVTFPKQIDFDNFSEYRYLFSINEKRYFTVFNYSIKDENYTYESKEIFRTVLPKEDRYAGIVGYQLCNWYLDHKFCSKCGRPLVHDTKERMLKCSCGMINYPIISPAIIVGIVHKDKLLITKYADRDYKKYALIAGFTEIGETLEGTVKREVLEEVSLHVKDIKYYGCQPWPFTGTLLVGFFARVDGDTHIAIDEEELSEGRWIARSDMDEIKDDGISLTREMMMAFKNNTIKW